LKDQGEDGRMTSKWTLGRLVGGVWSGFTWLRIGTIGGLLWMRRWTLCFWRHRVGQSAYVFARWSWLFPNQGEWACGEKGTSCLAIVAVVLGDHWPLAGYTNIFRSKNGTFYRFPVYCCLYTKG
jgi:hypothetical protein